MKIYLAGAEGGDSKLVIEKNLIENAFISYYYEGRRSKSNMPWFRKNIKSIIVDSGAHTFFSETELMKVTSSVRKKTKTKDTPEEFFQKYKQWLIINQDNLDYFVELDIGELVGQDTVLKWRQELKDLGLYKKCITVYHPACMSYEDWISTLEDSQSKYVALEGVRGGKWILPYLKLIKDCYDRKIKVHGFGMTKEKVYNNYPFYSVDSSSWKAGSQFGCQKYSINEKNKLVTFKNKVSALSINSHLAIKTLDNNLKIQRFSRYALAVETYRKIEENTRRLWQAKGINWEKQIL